MKYLINHILRGIVIGVANIIPGVSGGTMMVSMGIYDTLIHCITHLFKEFWKSIKTLLPYAIGMLIGILALASVITWGLENYPLPTNTLFIGLILGGLGPLIKKVDRKKINAAAIIAFVCLFALIIWMGLQNKDSIQNADSIDMNISQMLLMVVLGAVASATMIIPGVSGSLVLMLLGYYKAVTGALQTLAHGLLRFDFSAVGQPLLMLIPFLIGVALGIFGVAKLIEWLTARYPTITYCGVLGLVIASPVSLLIQTDMSGATAFIILISIVTFAVGFAGAFLLAKNSKE
jgi:putative membrane protein